VSTEFWGMTPYLTKLSIRALLDKNNTEAWTIAALTRAKKLPKLSEMMIVDKPVNQDMEQSLKETLMNMGGRKKNG
jgi:hypothetical protein